VDLIADDCEHRIMTVNDLFVYLHYTTKIHAEQKITDTHAHIHVHAQKLKDI